MADIRQSRDRPRAGSAFRRAGHWLQCAMGHPLRAGSSAAIARHGSCPAAGIIMSWGRRTIRASPSQRLLAPDRKVDREVPRIISVAKETHLDYRMTEGNSCYRGGKPGVSNAFCSALWAADYLLKLASFGCAGVNLHGGGASVIRTLPRRTSAGRKPYARRPCHRCRRQFLYSHRRQPRKRFQSPASLLWHEIGGRAGRRPDAPGDVSISLRPTPPPGRRKCRMAAPGWF